MRVGGRRWMRISARLGPAQFAVQVVGLVVGAGWWLGFDLLWAGVAADAVFVAWLLLVLVIGLPGLLSWGHFHVHLQRNGRLDARGRRRWRAAFFIGGVTPTLYWRRHVRDHA